MKFRYTLRTRVAIVSGLLSLLIGLFYLGAMYVQNERLENDLIEATLKRTLDGVLATRGPVEAPSLPPDIELYGPTIDPPPEFLSGLGPGRHEIDRDGRTYEVLVADAAAGRYVISYDETLNENRESRFYLMTVAVIAGSIIVAVGLGYIAAGRAIAPLSHFARRLQKLQPGEPAAGLRTDYERTEVGEIAEAFERYHSRLSGFIQREREFTADASHELRTPLAVIRNAAELLRLPDLSPDRQQRAAQRIDRAAGQMSELVNALLFLAREEGRRADAGAPPCRVDEIAAELVEDHRVSAGAKALQLEFRVDAPVVVAGERALVATVIGNLLDNAIHYTEAGSVTVTVGDGGLVIEDTGPGIPDDELPRVFERHFRGSGRRPRGGSGLGLSISQRICELHGWTLELESEPGRGARAAIRFSDRPADTAQQAV